MLHILTPTGGRPEGLALLAEYIEQQSYTGPAMWVVVDDVNPPSYVPATRFTTQIIRPPWRWDGKNTQARSMLAALAVVPDDAVILICEDDDLYLPGYIEAMLEGLESADLVGESEARYYNVRTGQYKAMPTKRHSSLASTAIRGKEALVRACKAAPKFIDTTLWRTFTGSKLWLDTHNVVGIKGLPGREGIGIGHRAHFGKPDTTDVLRQWAGDYADNYGIFR